MRKLYLATTSHAALMLHQAPAGIDRKPFRQFQHVYQGSF